MTLELRLWPFFSFAYLLVLNAEAADDYSFDASAFEKKSFELGGYVQVEQDHFTLNRDAAFYKLGYFGQSQRDNIDRSAAIAELNGKLRKGIGTFNFNTYSSIQRDQLSHDHNNVVYEAAYSIRPDPGMTLEAGKKTMRWGKGYAWSPIGFVERPKDPNDPDLAREGYGMVNADLIVNRDGPLQTIAFTPVLLPVENNLNSDFGSRGHLNPAAKLYLLYRDTDIDFAWQGQGSRPGRYGMDLSRNLTSNFEIHGEWARVHNYLKPVIDGQGNVGSELDNATSYLVGLRYLTEGETTYILEYYRNGTGYSDTEAQEFYQFVDAAFSQFQQTGNATLIQKAVTLSQGSYGRPNPGQHYVYFRAQMKDALGIIYFLPAISTIVNQDDRSFQVTPELLYTGVTNFDLRLRFYALHGGHLTEFGEKQNLNRLEFYARYYF